MTETFLQSLESADWLTIGCFLFVAIGAAIIASYRHYRKPAPKTPMRLAQEAEQRRARNEEMRQHRFEVTRWDFVRWPH